MRGFFLLSLVCISFVFAKECDPCTPCLEYQPLQAPEQVAYNAPYYTLVQCPWDIFVKGSFLYLEAKEENLSIGTTLLQVFATGIPTPGAVTRIPDVFNYEYKPAFDIGMGVEFETDHWQIFGKYTYFRSNVRTQIGPLIGSSDATTTTTEQVLPTWYGYVINPNNFTLAKGSWDLRIDQAELDLSRDYFVGTCFIIRTKGGLKGTWIRQSLEADYTGSQAGLNPTFTAQYNTDLITKSWGVGPLIGMDIKWLFCGGFRFFSNNYGALLYTQYTNIQNNSSYKTFNITDSSLIAEALDGGVYQEDPCFIRPEAKMHLGFGWGGYICTNRVFFDFEVGYLFHVLFSQNVFLYTNVTSTDIQDPEYSPSFLRGGDLSYHGLAFSARVDF